MKFENSGFETGVNHTIFRVLEVKRSTILQKPSIRNCFAYILGFIFYGVSRAKTNLHNKYMI